MASNPWRVDRYAPLSEFTDKLGRTFEVIRAHYQHQPGKGYAARLLKRTLIKLVNETGSQRKAADALGISLGKLQRELRKVA